MAQRIVMERPETPQIDYYNVLYRTLFPTLDEMRQFSLVDLGCGYPHYTQYMPFREKSFVDTQPREGLVVSVINQDVVSWLRENEVDILFASDLIEHLFKKDGEELLDLTEKHIRNRAIFFTPLGPLWVNEVIGTSPDEHRSGWFPEDFEKRGYDTWVLPGFHRFADGEHGAFFARKLFHS